MTEVEFSYSKKKQTVTLSIKGHAGAGPKGEDNVCASISILGYTFAKDIYDMKLDKRLKKEPIIELDDGNFYISARARADDFAAALHSLFVIMKGFVLLENKYPEFVHIKRFDEAGKPVSDDKSGMLH